MMKMMFGWEGELFFSLLPEHADTTSNTVNVIATESSEDWFCLFMMVIIFL